MLVEAQRVSPVWSDHLHGLLSGPLPSCWHTSGHDHSSTENSPMSHHFYCRGKSAVLITASKILHHFVLMRYWINIICPSFLVLFQLHLSPCYSSLYPAMFLPQGLCTCCFRMEHSFPRYLHGLFPHCLQVFAQILSTSPANSPYFLFYNVLCITFYFSI